MQEFTPKLTQNASVVKLLITIKDGDLDFVGNNSVSLRI
jgi:hypothetical protein